jgi:hypothetical protein
VTQPVVLDEWYGMEDPLPDPWAEDAEWFKRNALGQFAPR